MYNVSAYGQMIADTGRTGAYEQALRRRVKPGSTVLDIGTGAGIMALLACRLGARRVYAIEPNDAIEVARQLAAVNGYTDRIAHLRQFAPEDRYNSLILLAGASSGAEM